MYKIYLFPIILFLIIACNKGEGETIESSYIDPLTIPQILKYNFTRNGENSVDILECSLIEEPLNAIYSSYMKEARISYQISYETVLSLYQEGLYHIQPEKEVAKSPLHITNRTKILQDIAEIINTSARISGYNNPNYYTVRNREALIGQTGYIGFNISDPNVAFVNEKGIVVSEVFNGMVMGAIYLDKILNYHLDESILNDKQLRINHQNVVLSSGKNYTELEHHWDLAYGYYSFWKQFAQPEIPILKDSDRLIFNAFVQGRIELGRYRYEAMKNCIKIIRKELSRVVAIRAMNYLVSENTLTNLKEGNGTSAFSFISKGMGIIYALQFTRREEGSVYFTYDDCKKMVSYLEKENGLWEQQRLLGESTLEGSLLYIANSIGSPFGITTNDLKR